MLLQLNDHEPRKGKKIGVTISFNNHRLFVGNIPKNRDRDELLEEFNKHARKRVLLRIEIVTPLGDRAGICVIAKLVSFLLESWTTKTTEKYLAGKSGLL